MNYSREIYRFISPGAILSLIFIYIHYNRKGHFLLFPKRIVLKATKFLVQDQEEPCYSVLLYWLLSGRSASPWGTQHHGPGPLSLCTRRRRSQTRTRDPPLPTLLSLAVQTVGQFHLAHLGFFLPSFPLDLILIFIFKPSWILSVCA